MTDHKQPQALTLPFPLDLVAWDFDRTILSGHSTGAISYYSSAHKDEWARYWATQITPEWLCQYRALKKAHVNQAVVTFADSTRNVSYANGSGVLAGATLVRAILSCIFDDQEAADLPVYGLLPEYQNSSMKHDGIRFPNNKQWHLKQAMKHYGLKDWTRVLLVDDSQNNL